MNINVKEYKYKPGHCPTKEPELDEYFGTEKRHSCPCGGTINICKNCGGDYHKDEEESKKCYLGK